MNIEECNQKLQNYFRVHIKTLKKMDNKAGGQSFKRMKTQISYDTKQIRQK